MTENIYRLQPEKSALVVVDIQERMMPAIPDRAEVIKNSVLLMKAANLMGVPVVATTQYQARIGPLLPEVQAELAGRDAIDKVEFNCLANEAINAAIKQLPQEINTLIVCGVETHICICQTVVGGLMNGYRMWVPADAVNSRVELNYRIGLDRIRAVGGVVASTEMIIYEWLQKAGTPVFKELLPYIK